jgi:hypothetical protein
LINRKGSVLVARVDYFSIHSRSARFHPKRGGQLHSVKPWRLEDVLGKPLGQEGMTYLEVEEDRIDGSAIRQLCESDAYPLQRHRKSEGSA